MGYKHIPLSEKRIVMSIFWEERGAFKHYQILNSLVVLVIIIQNITLTKLWKPHYTVLFSRVAEYLQDILIHTRMAYNTH